MTQAETPDHVVPYLCLSRFFTQLYQKLYEAPDPAPCLSLAAETASRAAELEAGMRKMSTELSEYRTESTAIKNQVRACACSPRTHTLLAESACAEGSWRVQKGVGA